MTNKLVFNLDRKGFPINIGTVEFFFGTTTEELLRFYDAQSEFEAKAKELEDELKGIKNTEDPNKEDALRVIELTKELARTEYDGLLGEGAFDKIYAVYTDVDQLIDLFDPIAFEVAEAIEQEVTKRNSDLIKKKNKLLKKRALKTKKK